MQHLSLILHDVRSVHNVASIFRTADGAGVSCIYLTGYTPAPVDRFGRRVSAFAKVSLGAEDTVPWKGGRESIELTLELIQALKKDGSQVVVLEQSDQSVSLGDFSPTFPAVLVVGNEVDGVPQEILGVADAVVEIPMHGAKESLNVAVATGVALYQLSTLNYIDFCSIRQR